jgi:hypothetical protein
MAFDRLQKLGNDKFQKVLNELARGTPAQTLARSIQQEWGDALNVREDTLAKQLKRLSATITNGAFGGDLAEQARKRASVRIKLLHGSTLDCLDELTQMAAIQKARVLRLWEKERIYNVPLIMLNRVIRDYGNLIVTIQEMKFNLGLDEYKRTIPGISALNTSVTLPDLTTIRQKALQAAAGMDEIFDRRGIPHVSQ